MEEGFEIPIRRFCLEPLLLAGIPRGLAYLLWIASAAIILGLRQLWFLPISLILHMFFAGLTRYDPYWPEMVLRALRSPEKLDV